jgi:hypothetical protein
MTTYTFFDGGFFSGVVQTNATEYEAIKDTLPTHVEGLFGREHYLKEGVPKLLPNKPSEFHRFDLATEAWFDPRTLDDLKEAHWRLMKQQRTAAEYGGFDWDGSRFDSNAASQSKIQGAAQLAQIAMMQGQPFYISWTLSNNTARTLNAAQMVAVGMAMSAHINACFERGRLLRSQIEAATTQSEVEAVAWS